MTTEEATLPLFRKASRTPFNIAPERSEELAADIFGSGKWTLNTIRTKANFYARPEDAAVDLSFAGMASLWCLARVAFHIIDIGSQAQRALKVPGQTVIDIGQEYGTLKLPKYLEYAAALFKADYHWPAELVVPDADAALSSVEGRINNVFYGALSWIILHEIGHVHHGHLEHIPSAQRISQEHQADGFATSWILDSAGNGVSREFRVLMISVALTWLFLCEREMGQGTTHPPAIRRFRAASSQFEMGDRSAGLEYSAYLFKAVLDPATAAPIFDTASELFAWTSGRLEALFPER